MKGMDGTISEGDVPAEIRREQILTFIKARDFARVADLSARFRVSEVTVRGDLDALAERGEIRRIRGGAMPRPLIQMERPGARVGRAPIRSLHLEEAATLDR